MGIVTRNNLNVVPNVFLSYLSTLSNIYDYNYNCIDKSLQLNTKAEWSTADETALDTWITANSIMVDYILLDIENVVISSIRELQKRVDKENSIKDKVQTYNYNASTQKLIVKVADTWTFANTTTLDNILDNLVGYDVITQLMNGYEIKAKDGSRYYNRKRSELVYRIQDPNDTLDSAGAFVIDSKLKNVKDSLLTGDWITAKTYLSSTVVEGDYTQELKDIFDAEIQEYIDNNY